MTTRPPKLPFLLCGAVLVLVGCQNGSKAIEAGVTTVHTSVADSVACEDDDAYEELEARVPQAARRAGDGGAVEPIEILLDREAGTLSVSEPYVQVNPGGQVRWVSEHDWTVLFMKSPSSPLQNGKRVVEGPPQPNQPRGARIRSGPDAICGKFDYTVVVEEGGRMYTFDPEVWVLRG